MSNPEWVMQVPAENNYGKRPSPVSMSTTHNHGSIGFSMRCEGVKGNRQRCRNRTRTIWSTHYNEWQALCQAHAVKLIATRQEEA